MDFGFRILSTVHTIHRLTSITIDIRDGASRYTYIYLYAKYVGRHATCIISCTHTIKQMYISAYLSVDILRHLGCLHTAMLANIYGLHTYILAVHIDI